MNDEAIVKEMIDKVQKIEKESSEDKFSIGSSTRKSAIVGKILQELESAIKDEDK